MLEFYSFTSFSFELFPFHNSVAILSIYIEVVNNSIFLAHPQFFLIHSGLGEVNVSYPLTNPLFKAS
jgi:hypothetical protein